MQHLKRKHSKTSTNKTEQWTTKGLRRPKPTSTLVPWQNTALTHNHNTTNKQLHTTQTNKTEDAPTDTNKTSNPQKERTHANTSLKKRPELRRRCQQPKTARTHTQTYTTRTTTKTAGGSLTPTNHNNESPKQTTFDHDNQRLERRTTKLARVEPEETQKRIYHSYADPKQSGSGKEERWRKQQSWWCSRSSRSET